MPARSHIGARRCRRGRTGQCRRAKTATAGRAVFGAADDLARSVASGLRRSLTVMIARRSLTVMIAANPIIAAAIIMRQFGIEAPTPRSGDEEEQEDEAIEDCRVAAVDQREEAL